MKLHCLLNLKFPVVPGSRVRMKRRFYNGTGKSLTRFYGGDNDNGSATKSQKRVQPQQTRRDEFRAWLWKWGRVVVLALANASLPPELCRSILNQSLAERCVRTIQFYGNEGASGKTGLHHSEAPSSYNFISGYDGCIEWLRSKSDNRVTNLWCTVLVHQPVLTVSARRYIKNQDDLIRCLDMSTVQTGPVTLWMSYLLENPQRVRALFG